MLNTMKSNWMCLRPLIIGQTSNAKVLNLMITKCSVSFRKWKKSPEQQTVRPWPTLRRALMLIAPQTSFKMLYWTIDSKLSLRLHISSSNSFNQFMYSSCHLSSSSKCNSLTFWKRVFLASTTYLGSAWTATKSAYISIRNHKLWVVSTKRVKLRHNFLSTKLTSVFRRSIWKK